MTNKFILVVDDEPSIREGIMDLLEVEGYECASVNNGLEAINFLNTHPRKPDVILLDQMMPKMTGEEFLVAVQKLPDHMLIPVILVSAAQDAHKIALTHSVSFVRKPLDADVLIKAIEKNSSAAR